MNFKKGISVGLAISLVLGSTMTAFASPNELVKSLGESKEKLMVLQAQIKQEPALQTIKDSDEVRVIVELDSEAVLEKATKKGIKLDEMSKFEVGKLQNQVLKEQRSLQSKISSKGIKFEVINSFTNVANGFSVKTTLGQAKKLESVAGVKSVTIANEYERPEPMMNNSGEIIKTKQTWASGYNGEGTVVAVIDTGVDSTHKDMVLTAQNKAELQVDEVQAISKEKKLPGTYRTTKVPYGYNYMDNNQEILDLGPDASMHGMHVAGTVGANGDTNKDGIKGVAPEAQILAMKVFGNDPAMASTFGDVIVKAIDDSVLLGADVINMSLGSTASFVDDTDLEQVAVNRAVDNGVVMAISAGNSNVFGNGYDNPYAENPDYGVVGSPGLATDSLQVASIENNVVTGYGLEFSIDGQKNIAPYTSSGTDILSVFKGQELKAVDCGLGGLPEHFPAEVKGNLALIERGGYNFTDKIANAEAAGATAVIVYNNASGGEGLISMMYPEGGTIPALFIGNSFGAKIATQLKTSEVKVVANGNTISVPNTVKGSMSDFTSWGTTPDLEFKPEITAPGGNIWSTLNNNKYGNMSGTSMASPHVAGGSALVLQRVDKEFKLTGEARAKMAKKLMMSTAIAHVDNGANQAAGVVAGPNYTSPRRQGAGVMDLQAATTTPAIVTDTTTGECKVNLKEIKDNKATFTIEVQNFSDKELTYNVAGTVQTDLVDDQYTYLEAQNIINKDTKKFPISFSNNTIKVAKNGKAQLTATVDLSNTITAFNKASIEDVFVNGGYVEGFVNLTDPTDTNPTLSIPYLGFKGEWDKAPAIDASIYETKRASFYGVTSIVNDNLDFLGVDLSGKNTDGNKVAFSPNGDGANDAILPVLSYLRNMKELDIEVLDKDGKVIRNLTQDFNVRKHYHDGKYDKYSIRKDATWDGTVNNKVVADGAYTYRVKAKVDYENAKWQNFDFKVNVDTKAPAVNKVNYNKDTKQLEVIAEDNNKGHVYKYVLISDGKVEEENATGKFDLSELDYKKCSVEVYDYAQNKTSIKVTEATTGEYKEPTGAAQGDTTIPTVMVEGPEFFGVSNSGKIVVEGTVKDASAIAEFTVNGKNVPLTFDTHSGLWNFSTEVELKDGYHSIMVAARDAANNKIEFAHKLFVDTTAPVINLEAVPSETTKDSVIISGKINDNLPSLKVKVNGNVVKTIAPDWSYFNDLESAKYDLAYEVKLAEGENKISVEAIDDAGNTTVKEITIKKVKKIVESTGRLYGKDRYATAVEVSKTGWKKSDMAVIANGTAYADALVAAPLAANYDAPILLTEAGKLTEATKTELKRLGVKTVYVVGGTSVISEATVKEMAKMGIDVVRLGGANRYETSLAVATQIDRQKNVENIYVAGGYAPADALTISSKAATDKTPIILVEAKKVPKKVLAWLKNQKLKSAYVIGGETVVKNSVMKDLNKITSEDIAKNRIGGADRYETNALVIEKLFAKEQKNMYVTESMKLVDSLVVAPLAAKTGSPVIITNSNLSDKQKSLADKMLVKKVVEVGGQVNKAAVQDLVNRINNK
ncbi:cell wall-binding repeat-containing protein [Clostridium sulfidigenes]|uniref:cell wall-binding repeat-containing protein n=1 Tax=Clostridium sulfidigenes TaxID=318464 RepID=UPI003F88AB2C